MPTRTSRPPSEPLRVLHVRNASGYYGAERCIVTWMRELQPRGFAFDVALYPHADASTAAFIDAARASGAGVHVLPRGHGRTLTALRRLVGLVRRADVDIIHAHENRTHVIAWLAGGLTGTPVVGTVHGYVPSSPKMERMNALNRTFLRGHRLAAVTAPTRELAALIGGATVMPNGLPASLASGEPAWAARPEPPTFGVVGRLNPEKGIGTFLDALEHLPHEWRFVVAGDGALEGTLRVHPAADRVAWLGFRDDARDLMRDFTALVMPSLTEGVPITLLEAMAQGVPIIASAVGGIPEVLENDHHARLVPAGNAAALAAALVEVAADPSGARVRAEAARERFLSDYTIERVGDALDTLYRALAGGAR